MARPLIKEGDSGPDVVDAILRLNLAGANPQVAPTETFNGDVTTAAKSFQSTHALAVDGEIGQNTWSLLDQLDGGRLIPATGIASVQTSRDQARALLDVGDFAGAKALLDPVYAQSGVPPEIRSPIAANLGWAEHGLGNVDRARALYAEQLATLLLFGGIPLAARDTLQRLREVNLGQPPGALPSVVNRQNLPPDG